MIAASGDESWWLLIAIFTFITVDYVVAWKAIKFLRLLMKFDKTLTEDSPLLVSNGGGVGGGAESTVRSREQRSDEL